MNTDTAKGDTLPLQVGVLEVQAMSLLLEQESSAGPPCKSGWFLSVFICVHLWFFPGQFTAT